MNDQRLRILGVPGSPYSRKLLAALRYRRLPYAWIVSMSPESEALPRPRVFLLPQLIEEGADGPVAITDTTPILRELDRRHAGREVRPPDPVIALLDSLLEDWADEWLTKAMFHYRWAFAADIHQAQELLPRWSRPDRSDDEARAGGRAFGERQIGRLGVVGSNETTAPLIEQSYRRALTLLAEHLAGHRFLLGARPGTGDFGVYGQLTQLCRFDPTPSAIALEVAPRMIAWTDFVDDLSGLEPSPADWMPRDAVPASLRAVLAEVGRLYVPFLLANAEAIASGAGQVECTLDGHRWVQQTFPYQAKCLRWLREEYAALTAADRGDADAILAGTACELLFR